jgi:hypothetical protein
VFGGAQVAQKWPKSDFWPGHRRKTAKVPSSCQKTPANFAEIFPACVRPHLGLPAEPILVGIGGRVPPLWFAEVGKKPPQVPWPQENHKICVSAHFGGFSTPKAPRRAVSGRLLVLRASIDPSLPPHPQTGRFRVAGTCRKSRNSFFV